MIPDAVGALIGVAGVAVGALLTQGFTVWNERLRWKRENSVRFDEVRRILYARFLEATDRLSNAKSYAEHNETLMAAGLLFQEVSLIARRHSALAAEKLLRRCDACFMLTQGGSGQQKIDNTKAMIDALHQFVVAVRSELRIELEP
jgi:hypothetical protein